MKLSFREAIVLAVTIALTFVGIAFGAYDPLWNLLHLPSELRSGMTTALTIAILLTGQTVAAAVREADHRTSLQDEMRELNRTIVSSLHGIEAFHVFATADSALQYLADRLKTANRVWNTRVPARGLGSYTTQNGRTYAAAVEAAVERGVYMRDVVGHVFEPSASALSATAKRTGKNNYEYVVQDDPTNPFFNFIILEDANGSQEVVFGWVITPNHGFEQNCFASRNQALITLFRSLHDFMMIGRAKALPEGRADEVLKPANRGAATKVT